MRRPVALGSLPLSSTLIAVAVVALASGAFAQQPGQPWGQPQPQPWGQPPAGQPPAGQPPAGQPPAGQPPAGQPPAGQPPAGQPPQPGTAGAEAGAGTQWGAEGGFQVQGPEAPAAPPAPADEDEKRLRTLAEQISLNGSTGLFRTSYAGSAAPGTFRVAAVFDWFSTSGFLCEPGTPCGGVGLWTEDPTAPEDDSSHIGALFALNATPLSFLEGYATIRTYANFNDQSSPALLQVLGDTTFGVKGFTPDLISNMFVFGGELRLLLLNGAGDVGVSGAGTTVEILGNASADFRGINDVVPARVHLNLGYRVDNSGELVEDVEKLRAERDPDTSGGLDRIPISRIERFGLGINRVDFFQIRFGADGQWRYAQPFIEYAVDIPVNRKDYECHTRVISRGDVCLALSDLTNAESGSPGYSAIPSRLSLGVRSNPLDGGFRGLSGMFGFDIGLSGTSAFIEEIAPTAPWTLYFGLGYAFDTKVKEVKPQIVQLPPPPAQQLPPPPEYYVRGLVKEKGTTQGVPRAIVLVQGSPNPPVATGADGRFQSYKLEPGAYSFSISAPGYKDGVCAVTIVPAAAPVPPPAAPAPAPGWPAAPGTPPGAAPPGTPPGVPPGTPPGVPPGTPPGTPPGAPPGTQPLGTPPPQPTGPLYTEVECELEALPRKGGVSGTAESGGSPVSGASIELIDAAGNKHTATSGSDGGFQFKELPPGEAKLRAEHDQFLGAKAETNVRPREDARVTLSLHKRPATPSVRIVANQLQVTQKIQFETDSAVIKGESFALVAEIADVLNKNPNLRKVEVQGHTDNTGAPQSNQTLSQNRADSVRTALIENGVDAGRLDAKGYGQTRPLAPNVTPANRARNRRVQFVILEKD